MKAVDNKRDYNTQFALGVGEVAGSIPVAPKFFRQWRKNSLRSMGYCLYNKNPRIL